MNANACAKTITPARTVGSFLNRRACSDTLFHMVSEAFGTPMPDEELAAMPFAGGILQHGFQCGMIWGACLAAGAQAFQCFGQGAQAETVAIEASRRLVAAFRSRFGVTDCLDITNINQTTSNARLFYYFLIKGGTIGCFRMATQYAPVAYEEIIQALTAGQETPSANGPTSCAAIVARRMGASPEHAVMAAGLAGGIGLCGGGCGALGAAVWLTGLNRIRSGGGKPDYKCPQYLNLMDRFSACTGNEFECKTIVDRVFSSAEDHSCHLGSGGCTEIIKALAGE